VAIADVLAMNSNTAGVRSASPHLKAVATVAQHAMAMAA